MGGKSQEQQKQTVGYSYFMSGLFGIAQKITNLRSIIYGERVAWSGNVSSGGVYVDNPNLYGGEEVGSNGGGLQGQFYLNAGTSTQTPDPVMKQYFGANSPAFRGLATLSMLNAYVASFSAQFKALYVKVQNLEFDWYPEKGVIASTEVNAIHVLRQVLIDPELCGQFTEDDIDDASFKAAADILYDENFGLSPIWQDSSSGQEFINDLLKHVDGTLIRDRFTGKFRIRLWRGGYDVDTLPVILKDDFEELTSMGSLSVDSTINCLTIQYPRFTSVGVETATITQYNAANIDAQGGLIAASSDQFDFVTNAISGLAGKILSRELNAKSYPLKAYTLKGYSDNLLNLQKGDLFVLKFEEEGYRQVVSRVLEVDYGTMNSHILTLTCTEDIYGAPVSSVVSEGGTTEWEDPFDAPEAPYAYFMQELPLALVVGLTGFALTDFAQYPLAGFVGTLAKRNQAIDRDYLHNKWDAEKNTFSTVGQGTFGDYAILQTAITKKDTVLQTYTLTGFTLEPDDLLFVGTEIMAVVSTTDTTITVLRGVLDTLPQEHAQAARIWLGEPDKGGYATTRYTEGDTAQIALSTVNSIGISTPTLADIVDVPMVARAYRPYPPAYLRCNGVYLPDSITGELTVAWYHRDRLEQLDVIIAQDEGDIGAEEGTTYTLNFYGEDGLLKKTVDGITENSYVWATEKEDCMLPTVPESAEHRYNNSVKVELWAVRDGYDSFQKWEHTVLRG